MDTRLRNAIVRIKDFVYRFVSIVTIFLMFLSSLSLPQQNVSAAVQEDFESALTEPEKKESVYRPPVFIHPKPVVGERPADTTGESDRGGETTQPLLFVENEGQTDERALFQVQGTSGTLNVANDGIWVTILQGSQNQESEGGLEGNGENAASQTSPALQSTPMPFYAKDTPGINLHFSFEGANPKAEVVGFDRKDTRVSYFHGNDPSQWKKDVPVWGGVKYVDYYPGVDLEISDKNGQLLQTLVLKNQVNGKRLLYSLEEELEVQTTSLDQIKFKVEGAEISNIDGEPVLSTSLGNYAMPLLEVVSGNNRSNVLAEGAKLLGTAAEEDEDATLFSLDVSGEPASEQVTLNNTAAQLESGHNIIHNSPDVIPLLQFSAYIGGTGTESGYAIAVDESGDSYVAGITNQTDFPVTPGVFQSIPGGSIDIFIVKMDANGNTPIYSSYLGGSGQDDNVSIAIGSDDSLYMSSRTLSLDFPTTVGCYDPTYNAPQNPTLTKISPDGSQLIFSTYFGTGQAHNLAVDQNDYVYLVGQTGYLGVPTTPGAYDRTFNGGGFDGFLAKFSPDGSTPVYSTLFGGSVNDCEIGGDHKECDVVVNDAGEVYISGMTTSTNFPTTANAYNRVSRGGSDAFVFKIDSTGSNLLYSTLLGGSGSELSSNSSLDLDPDGNIFVTG